MKRWLLAVVLVWVVPWVMAAFIQKPDAVVVFSAPTERPEPTTAQTDPAPSTTPPTQPPENALTVRVKGDTVQEMDLEDYILRVVLGEMPASFETEALKAQSVVARTFTYRAMTVSSKHTDADICTDPNCCQAYCDPGSFSGTQAELDKVTQAVEATAGQVLTYEDQLIEALYFSCSGGKTEDAVAVWGTNVPYLTSVDSPGEENAAHYTDTVRFTTGEFAALLGRELTGDPATWLGDITYTAGGGVDRLTICGQTYRGTELRSQLGLRSTVFVITALGNSVTVTTRGYGHRVGMSQYGADAMAVQGSTYDRILFHYYRGTALEKISDLQV